MSTKQQPRDSRRHRLATNDNETVVDDLDTEGHRLATNDNETTVPAARRAQDDEAADGPAGDGPGRGPALRR